MSNQVLVLDTNRKPLTPCRPITARKLLDAGKAAVFRRYPFTIILKKEVADTPEPCQLKIDPGSKVTGFAILKGDKVIFGAELTHRGLQIKSALESRRALRRGRRNRKTRYRKPRFLNRTRADGWLPPSLQHRVETVSTWVERFRRYCPIDSIAMELVRFDLQKEQNPEISGIEYQQGELHGYEVRQYLLEKWGRQCAYCGKENTPFEVEHIHPKSKGGSDRVSNLTIACHECNQAKGNQDVKAFLKGKPDLLESVLEQAKRPLKDAAAVNSTRWPLFNRLKQTGLPVSAGSGGKTKFNRTKQGLAKTHWLDAACVGETPTLQVLTTQPLLIKASGHGCRQVIHVYGDKVKLAPWPTGPGFQRRNKAGELVRKSAKVKLIKGFQTGDMVKADVPTGKKQGVHVGRVAVRSTGSFNISTVDGTVQGINAKYCKPIHLKDGFAYGYGLKPHCLKAG